MSGAYDDGDYASAYHIEARAPTAFAAALGASASTWADISSPGSERLSSKLASEGSLRGDADHGT